MLILQLDLRGFTLELALTRLLGLASIPVSDLRIPRRLPGLRLLFGSCCYYA